MVDGMLSLFLLLGRTYWIVSILRHKPIEYYCKLPVDVEERN